MVRATGKGKEKEIEENGRSRNWCFTINNPTTEPEEIIRVLEPNVKFAIFQFEKGESGTKHYQGYLRWNENTRLSALKKLEGDFARAHFKIAKGNEQQNIVYCTKQDTRIDGPWEIGERSHQGKRTDLDSVVDLIKSGATLKRVAEECPREFIKYPRGIKEYMGAINERNPRDFETELWVFYGAPGTGKSYAANQMARPHGAFTPNFGVSGIWWDGYNGQEFVLFDEFKCNIPLGLLKRLADRYECTVDIKGLAAVQFTSRVIIITTNLDWDFWYVSEKISQVERDALRRRIRFMARFDALDQDPVIEIDERKNSHKDAVIPRPPKN